MMKRLIFLVALLSTGLNAAKAPSTVLEGLIAAREQGTPVSYRAATATNRDPFFKTHVVVFFFASTCPHCHTQAPVLLRWANVTGARIEARSFDDKPLPGFETQRPVTRDLVDVAFAGRPISYPALFVMNETNSQLFPVAFGTLNDEELEARMTVLIPTIQRYEQRGPA